MSESLAFWVVIVVLGIGTYLLRATPILWHGKMPMPTWLTRVLRHVPAAALTALVVPGALYLKTDGIYEFAPARIAAALIALLVMLKWRNMVATLVVGMVALWAIQAVL